MNRLQIEHIYSELYTPLKLIPVSEVKLITSLNSVNKMAKAIYFVENVPRIVTVLC